MKKYIKPIAIEVKMESAAVMASVSGDLEDTSSGGTTGDNGVKDADAKGGMWDLGD